MQNGNNKNFCTSHISGAPDSIGDVTQKMSGYMLDEISHGDAGETITLDRLRIRYRTQNTLLLQESPCLLVFVFCQAWDDASCFFLALKKIK